MLPSLLVSCFLASSATALAFPHFDLVPRNVTSIPITTTTPTSTPPPTTSPTTTASPTATTYGVNINFPDQKVPFGDVDPTTIINGLNDHCDDIGTCDPQPWSTTMNLPGSPGGLEPYNIIVNAATSYYPTWAKGPLIQALAAAAGAQGVMDVQNTTYSPNTICLSGPDCVWQPDQPITLYTFPSGMEIVMQSPDQDAAPIAVMSFSVTIESQDGAGGFCSTLDTVATGVASMLNGVAAGIFTLLGLGCMAL